MTVQLVGADLTRPDRCPDDEPQPGLPSVKALELPAHRERAREQLPREAIEQASTVPRAQLPVRPGVLAEGGTSPQVQFAPGSGGKPWV